ncbi:uncharacterized protein BP01DRAFT_54489 [Aspergillus saccharolyticus JOP 1030-1]|uniref:Secreted protein n=1 Tax=Aspergillus saccharolyticus JOP 1030-1 TaxID=1450539 RepID=A0A318ZFL8_9EURO|nr:hypothetical protein BP01DRAFT_54489 [Aspergillus saccharolyticus JOP 1030-1]PYH45124.1 hypothetical protein BP01DRAFT_54489 [Aspergillus saccharolyticus JOP 1030-1]
MAMPAGQRLNWVFLCGFPVSLRAQRQTDWVEHHYRCTVKTQSRGTQMDNQGQATLRPVFNTGVYSSKVLLIMASLMHIASRPIQVRQLRLSAHGWEETNLRPGRSNNSMRLCYVTLEKS